MECKVKCFFSIFVQEWLESGKGLHFSLFLPVKRYEKVVFENIFLYLCKEKATIKHNNNKHYETVFFIFGGSCLSFWLC